MHTIEERIEYHTKRLAKQGFSAIRAFKNNGTAALRYAYSLPFVEASKEVTCNTLITLGYCDCNRKNCNCSNCTVKYEYDRAQVEIPLGLREQFRHHYGAKKYNSKKGIETIVIRYDG